MRIGMGFLAGLCLVLGLGPTVVVPLLDRVSEPFVGISIAGRIFEMGGMTLAPVSEEFSSLSTPVLAMVLIGLTGLGLGLAYVLGGKGKKRFYKTWGCGLNLTARNEYTATGFVSQLSGSLAPFISRPSNSKRNFLKNPTISRSGDTLNSRLSRSF